MAGGMASAVADAFSGAALAGVLGAWACRADAARSEAAKESHNDGAKVLIFMILGDPVL